MASDVWPTSLRDRARDRLRRAAGPCWICGEAIDYSIRSPDPMSFEVDHKISKFRSPDLAGDPSNWASSHRKCNRSKSDREFAPVIRRSGVLK